MAIDDRRTFLQRVILGASGLVSGALGGVAAGYLLGGARRGERARRISLIPVSDLLPGQPIHVDYRELVLDAWRTVWHSGSVWLVRGDGDGDVDITVFDPRCTHMGCPYQWDAGGGVFKCACHGGVFDVDGRVIAGPPPRPLDRLECRVVDGRVLIEMGGPQGVS